MWVFFIKYWLLYRIKINACCWQTREGCKQQCVCQRSCSNSRLLYLISCFHSRPRALVRSCWCCLSSDERSRCGSVMEPHLPTRPLSLFFGFSSQQCRRQLICMEGNQSSHFNVALINEAGLVGSHLKSRLKVGASTLPLLMDLYGKVFTRVLLASIHQRQNHFV